MEVTHDQSVELFHNANPDPLLDLHQEIQLWVHVREPGTKHTTVHTKRVLNTPWKEKKKQERLRNKRQGGATTKEPAEKTS